MAMIKPPLSADTIKQPFWSIPTEESLKILATESGGLKTTTIAVRSKIFSRNVIMNGPRFTRLRILGRQIANPLIIILLIAGIITTFLGDLLDSIVIFSAVTVNIAMGYWQEHKAETILKELTNYIRTIARVVRDGTRHEIDATMLVPGDIIQLSRGMRIPADGRLLSGTSFEVDESILTGESLPEKKQIDPLPLETPLAERSCMIYGGTLVVSGFATAVVTATGRMTEVGRIAHLSAIQRDVPSPIQTAVAKFSRTSGIVIALFAVALFTIGIKVGYEPLQIFVISVAVAVSAVPESLPIALTVIMTIGVERLAKRHGIVRRLLAAETLGSTSVILTDKTGTLTRAKMTISDILPWNAKGKQAKDALLADAILNTDVIIENPNDAPKKWQISGRPLETSLVRGAAERNILLPTIRTKRTIVERVPFDATKRYSLVLLNTNHGTRSVVLGAPETILDFCTLTKDTRIKIFNEINKRAQTGERILGLASSDATGSTHTSHIPPKHLTFRGLIVFRDPLRPSAKRAVKQMRDLNVLTIIVTGDHRGTAVAVARELNIPASNDEVLTGADLDQLKDNDLIGRLHRIRVFARATPEHKLRIVDLYRRRGDVVAVTGDGVNDAPALRAADIGVAVGSGTEVAKSAADLIIMDDNFGTIVAAVTEGRRILQNIRKVMVYLLSDALDEVMLIGGALILGIALPLNALQILYVNLFSDSFPAIAFAFEQRVDTDQKRRAIPKLFDPETTFLIFVLGAFMSIAVFGIYLALLHAGYPAGLVRTFTYALFATYTLFVAFSLRSLHESILTYNPFDNLPLTAGVGLGLILTIVSIYFPPLANVLHNEPLPLPWILSVGGLGLASVALIEVGKWIFSRNRE